MASEESNDAERVDEALRLLLSHGDLDAAEALLLEVARHAPSHYERETQQGDERCIRFWEEAEFLHFVTFPASTAPGRVAWVKSAYPRAFYYLGFLRVSQGRFEEAVAFLDAGLALEPDSPKLVCEKAQALNRLGRHAEALALYQSVRELSPRVSAHDLGLAIRGQGCSLIDLGRLEDAEAAFRRSQEFDPGSPVARDELQYIAHLRAGYRPGGVSSTVVQASRERPCVRCGQEVKVSEGATVQNVGGQVQYICRTCLPKKQWWQFWK